ncbi:MAG: twin transmembrane helix small protein [Betaproteobacteria bacterium]
MLTKILIFAMLALILASLFSALAMLFRKDDPDKRARMVQALTVRVSLSIGLFLMLLAGFYFGIIPQQGLK